LSGDGVNVTWRGGVGGKKTSAGRYGD